MLKQIGSQSPAACRILCLATVVVLALPGCRVKNPPDTAAIQLEALPTYQIPDRWRTAPIVTDDPVADHWLAGFGDEQLSAAVSEALTYNADLKVGAARIEQALLYAKLAGAKLWPTVDLLARGGGKMSGDGSGLEGGALTVNWELDLWGRVRNGRAAAVDDAMSAMADFEYARQSIAAVVARSWFLAIEAGLQAGVARTTIENTEALVRLAEARSQVGVGNDDEVFIARASAGTYRDTLRQLELARDQAVRAIEIVLGRYPSGMSAVSAQLPRQPDPVPGGLPSSLLERRPDVIAAERRIAAAFHRVGEAKAARLPAIALTTGVSSVSSDLFVLAERDNPLWNFGANLLMPVFRGGALKTQVEIRTAEQRQAVAAYAQVGQRAFSEVENALSAEIAARDREAILAQALADNRRAFEIVQTQFNVGRTDLRAVTQRSLAMNAVESAVIRVQTEQRVQRVNTYLAFGGRFEGQPAAPGSGGAAPQAAPPQQ